jgi:hypothetical protein
MIFYVVPAEFFESAEQSAFWDVNVRRMGAISIAQQYLAVGSSTTCNSDSKFLSETYVASQKLSNEKLKLIGILATQTKRVRKAFDFGRRLFAKSRQTGDEEDPHISSEVNDFRKDMGEIIEGLEDYIRTKTLSKEPQCDSLIATQVRFMQLSDATHRDEVERHLYLESNQPECPEKYKHTRQLLLVFNRSMKLFCQHFEPLIQNDRFSELLPSLRQIYISLEVSRSLLFYDPSSPNCGAIEDRDERLLMDQLIYLFEENNITRSDSGSYVEMEQHENEPCEDHIEINEEITKLLKTPGLSLVHKYVAHIIRNSLASGTISSQEQLESLRQSCDRLYDIRAEGRNARWPAFWETFIDHWIEQGNKSLSRLVADGNGTPGSDVEMSEV